MAKKETSRYSGDMEAGERDVQEQRLEKMVQITFRGNRKFDLQIGRETIVFRGRETKTIPARYLKTKDWAQQKSKFVVREVNNG